MALSDQIAKLITLFFYTYIQLLKLRRLGNSHSSSSTPILIGHVDSDLRPPTQKSVAAPLAIGRIPLHLPTAHEPDTISHISVC